MKSQKGKPGTPVNQLSEQKQSAAPISNQVSLSRSARPCPISYNGESYDTLKEFAAQNNLNYSKVLAYHRKGKSPEEIVELCQFSAASKASSPPKETSKRYLVEYNGVQYTSLYAAAEALGLAPSRLYDLRKKKNLSPAEAIEYALTHLAKAGKGDSPNANPCVVEGVTYPSREAAMQAYRIPRITVYSRMEREGISFEEALIRGRDSAVYRAPATTPFFNFHLIPAKNKMGQATMAELSRSLSYYRCDVKPMQDLISNTQILFVNDHSYVFYNKKARGVEIISELPTPAGGADESLLNVLNGAFIVTKVFTHPMSGRLYLTAFQSAKEEGQEIKSLLNTWFSFSSIRDKLVRTFRGEEGIKENTPTNEPASAAMAFQEKTEIG